jgi:hypothetical protein
MATASVCALNRFDCAARFRGDVKPYGIRGWELAASWRTLGSKFRAAERFLRRHAEVQNWNSLTKQNRENAKGQKRDKTVDFDCPFAFSPFRAFAIICWTLQLPAQLDSLPSAWLK